MKQILEEKDFQEIINKQENKNFIFKVTAEWCGACQAMKETFIEIEKKIKEQQQEVVFEELDITDNKNLKKVLEKEKIFSIPSLLMIKKKNNNTLEKNVLKGYFSKEELEKKIKEFFKF